MIAIGDVIVVERHPVDRSLGPLLRALGPHIQRPRLGEIVAQIEPLLRHVLEAHRHRVVIDRLARRLHRSLDRLLLIVGEDEIFGERGISREQLTHVALALALNVYRHAVRALALVEASQQLPRRIDAAHLEHRARRPFAHLNALPGRRDKLDPLALTRAVRLRHLKLSNHLAPRNRSVALDLHAEVDERADHQHDDAGVDHPHAEVHRLEGNAAQRGHDDVGRDQDHQQLKRPPVEPLEFGHLQPAPLPQLVVRPVVGGEDVPTLGVHHAGRTDGRVDKQDCQQADSEPDIREEVEHRPSDATAPPRSKLGCRSGARR